MDYSICCIKECKNPSLALGLCNKHWRRNKKYGSPVAIRHHAGMYIGMPAEDRFHGRYRKVPSGCWEWTGCRDGDGYGSFKGDVRGIPYQRAHRFSYALHKGDVPKGMHVCHTCDNPSCVNPDHLWIGTNRENMHDKIAKNRHNIRKGEDNAHAKITQEQAQQILVDPRPYTLIAAEYGLMPSTIGSIKNRASWTMLEGEAVKPARHSPRRGKSKNFTPEDILAIRASSEKGNDLARKYNVTAATICDIQKRRSWRHI